MQFFKNLFSKSLTPQMSSHLPWLTTLTGMDDITAIEYSTQQLNIDFKNNLFNDEQCLPALFSADEKNHINVETITAYYINFDNISIELEECFTQSVFLYHRQIFLIYLALMENLAPNNHPSLLMMLVRAMHSATQMIKGVITITAVHQLTYAYNYRNYIKLPNRNRY